MVTSTVPSTDLGRESSSVPPSDEAGGADEQLWPADGILSLLNAATIMEPRASAEDISHTVVNQYGVVHMSRRADDCAGDYFARRQGRIEAVKLACRLEPRIAFDLCGQCREPAFPASADDVRGFSWHLAETAGQSHIIDRVCKGAEIRHLIDLSNRWILLAKEARVRFGLARMASTRVGVSAG
jgi:hypothetical protein